MTGSPDREAKRSWFTRSGFPQETRMRLVAGSHPRLMRNATLRALVGA